MKRLLRVCFIFLIGSFCGAPLQGFAADANAEVTGPSAEGVGKTATAVPASGILPFLFQKAEPSKWSEGWYEGAEGYEKAFDEFEKTGKPMAVYMSVGWCPYCRTLEKEILSSPEVREFLKDKIKVNINPESGRAENVLAYRYNVSGFPSFFVHRPGTKKVARLYTGETPQQFIEQFKYFTE